MRRKLSVFFIFVFISFFVFENILIQAHNVPENFTVLYDGYHSIYGASIFNTFNSRLPAQFVTEYTYKPLTEEKLSTCDILAISHPIEAYSWEEIYFIKKFVEEGGGLLAIGTGWAYVDYFKKSIGEYPLNQIAREFGVTMNDDIIIDPTNYHSVGEAEYPIFTNFAAHPVTEGLARVYAGSPSSFSITGNAVPIVRGDGDAYSANYHTPIYETGDFPPVAIALEYNEGRAVFIGNDGFLGPCLDDYDNSKFGLNIYYWLSEPSSTPLIDSDNDGYSPPQDCNDSDSRIHPGAVETCDGKDNDCNGVIDDGFDQDNDGYTFCDGDCNDYDPNSYPGAVETCDGKDNDCNGVIDDGFDQDNDGYTTCNGDCNDSDRSISPGAIETCDGKDNNCNGLIDEGLDQDNDNYTACGGDCNDSDPRIHPGAAETCDGEDNDCDGVVDEGFDKDGDSYTICGEDCNDSDPHVYPGASETCDGKDNDCDGVIDEGFDQDNDGYTFCDGDCNNSDSRIHPGAVESCDGEDNDCDGVVDEGFDQDNDGYTFCNGDCNDNDSRIHPGASETCDGEDNDCDDVVDEGFDQDNDGYTTCGGDKNDNDPHIYPGAPDSTKWVFYGLLGAFIAILAISSRTILKPKRKGEIPEFLQFVTRKNTQDLMILSLERRTETEYQVSLESVHKTIHPVRSARTIDISPEMRSDVIARIQYTSRAISKYFDSGRKKPLKKPTEELERMGTIIYKNFIPRDFAQKLIHHYMVLEVEDVQIPWELMYSDQFFALKYALSRRVKIEKVPEIHRSKEREKKALIIADPIGTMPEAEKECEFLRKTLHRNFAVTYLRPEEARKVDVMYHFSQGYDIIHYAGELRKNSCLPLYRDELTCAEIERNLEGSPVVFINGCGSAKTFSCDIEGMAKAFLQRGALSFIGSLWNIHDSRAAEIAAEFYTNCLHHPVGEALRLSRKKYYSSENITWAAFVMYGDPTLNLCG